MKQAGPPLPGSFGDSRDVTAPRPQAVCVRGPSPSAQTTDLSLLQPHPEPGT